MGLFASRSQVRVHHCRKVKVQTPTTSHITQPKGEASKHDTCLLFARSLFPSLLHSSEPSAWGIVLPTVGGALPNHLTELRPSFMDMLTINAKQHDHHPTKRKTGTPNTGSRLVLKHRKKEGKKMTY